MRKLNSGHITQALARTDYALANNEYDRESALLRFTVTLSDLFQSPVSATRTGRGGTGKVLMGDHLLFIEEVKSRSYTLTVTWWPERISVNKQELVRFNTDFVSIHEMLRFIVTWATTVQGA